MKMNPKSSGKKGKPKDDFGERIRNSPVTYDDLRTALLAVDRMSPDDRTDRTARTMAVMRAFGLLTGKEDNEKLKLIEKVTCVEVRLEAMSRLVGSGILDKWTMESDERGAEFISGAVIRAAAEVPLLGGGKRSDPSHFEPDTFLAKVLELAEQEGSA